MIMRSRSFDLIAALVIVLGIFAALGPLYLAAVAASQSKAFLAQHRVGLVPGPHLLENVKAAWVATDLGRKLLNSFIVCALVTGLRLALAATSAFAIVFFRTPLRSVGFGLIFLTLVLPLETRIAPTYGVAADVSSPFQAIANLFGAALPLHWSLLDSYLGLSLPLTATATGTFLFIQVFRALPDELVDAAKVDGVGPLRFMIDIALPLTRGSLGALAIVTFIAAWNQYLWPLLITTRPDMQTAVLAVTALLPDPQDSAPAWNLTMAGVLLVILPPLILVAVFQRALFQGAAGKGMTR
jgi:sn-glycerol 3-phosphate transport system permease protein